MKCEMCGAEFGQDVVFCSKCGAKVVVQDAPGPDQSFAQPQQGQYQPQQSQYQGQYQPPYGQNQGYPQGQYPPQYQHYVDRGKSAKVVGILALIFGCLGGFVGVILGCVGLGMSNKVLIEEPGNRSAQAGRTCSVIGLILGVVIFIAVAASNA